MLSGNTDKTKFLALQDCLPLEGPIGTWPEGSASLALCLFPAVLITHAPSPGTTLCYSCRDSPNFAREAQFGPLNVHQSRLQGTWEKNLLKNFLLHQGRIWLEAKNLEQLSRKYDNVKRVWTQNEETWVLVTALALTNSYFLCSSLSLSVNERIS